MGEVVRSMLLDCAGGCCGKGGDALMFETDDGKKKFESIFHMAPSYSFPGRGSGPSQLPSPHSQV